MFDAGSDASGLDPLDKSDGDSSREVRVLGITFEVSARQGVAVEVDRGSEYDPRAFAVGLFGQGFAHCSGQCFVPSRCKGASDWEASRAGTADAIAPNAIGPIAHLEGGETQTRYRRGVPWSRTGAKRDLLFKGEGPEDLLNPRPFGFHRSAPVRDLESGIDRA
jgi:hypothetical protein